MIIDAVIPAREGSKRLPGKNLALLGGIPLVSHSIRFAVANPQIRRVLVSTDSDEIASVAISEGALVVERPAELATDRATTSSVLEHAWRSIPGDAKPEAIATLQPTSPFRLPAWIGACVDRLDGSPFDSTATVSPVSTKVGTVEAGEYLPQYTLETRSQDLRPRYRENGVIYLTRAESIAGGSIFGKRVGAVIIDHLYATIDIDELADLNYAEAVMGMNV